MLESLTEKKIFILTGNKNKNMKQKEKIARLKYLGIFTSLVLVAGLITQNINKVPANAEAGLGYIDGDVACRMEKAENSKITSLENNLNKVAPGLDLYIEWLPGNQNAVVSVKNYSLWKSQSAEDKNKIMNKINTILHNGRNGSGDTTFITCSEPLSDYKKIGYVVNWDSQTKVYQERYLGGITILPLR
jgi:hypothetical protein